jgi:hypothetical protein
LALVMEMGVAAVVFLAACVVVLVRSPLLMEPDDYAYRASIIALSQGHLLLTNAQYVALKARLSVHGGPGIAQWVHLRSGNWISQKNPGYPFFSVVFQWLHALRLAPLFYEAIGCMGLFYGARIWLGRWGGVCAVALYCFSGAALIFAWRPTMPTLTDASLIAAAVGLLLGVLLARDDPPSRRLLLGALAFLALDGATFIRYTDVVVLAVALIAVTALARVCRLSWPIVLAWFAMVAAFGVFDFFINHVLYGGAFTTGYRSGLVSFKASAVVPNIERMPSRLIESVPMALIALIGVVWIAVRLWTDRGQGSLPRASARGDAFVALVLSAGWLAEWGLYSAYTWTVGQTLGPGNPIHVVRFYVPVLGLIALLASWLLVRLRRWVLVVLLAVLVGLALWSYVTPSNDLIVGRAPGPSPSAPTRVPAPLGPPTPRVSLPSAIGAPRVG